MVDSCQEYEIFIDVCFHCMSTVVVSIGNSIKKREKNKKAVKKEESNGEREMTGVGKNNYLGK